MKTLIRLSAVAVLALWGLGFVVAQDEPAPAEEAAAETEPAADEAASEEDAAAEAAGEEPAAEEAPPEASVKVILANLNNPCGVAVQPETGHLFVSDSGSGRVFSFNPAERKRNVKLRIKDFPQDVYGKGPMYDIGPLGLAFLDQNTLVVGGGELKDGEELVRIYDVSSDSPLTMDQMKYNAGPIGPGEDSLKGEGNFYGVAASKSAIYLTSNGDDTKGWVARVPLTDGVPGALEPFIPTKVRVETTDAPVGITLNRDGQLVVGQMGEVNVPADSLYTVYDPETGELMTKIETGLHDIAGLAFSPKTGSLYAVDFAWVDATQGGLYRLDVESDELTKVKIA
jgi:DNA-binding beta-propeller fold protein YncE